MTEKNKTPLVVLVDGSNYIYRAFYAIPLLTNSKGFPTNAIYGFTNMLMKLMRDLAPDYIVVTFDLRGPTTRHGEFEDYKAAPHLSGYAILATLWDRCLELGRSHSEIPSKLAEVVGKAIQNPGIPLNDREKFLAAVQRNYLHLALNP